MRSSSLSSFDTTVKNGRGISGLPCRPPSRQPVLLTRFRSGGDGALCPGGFSHREPSASEPGAEKPKPRIGTGEHPGRLGPGGAVPEPVNDPVSNRKPGFQIGMSSTSIGGTVTPMGPQQEPAPLQYWGSHVQSPAITRVGMKVARLEVAVVSYRHGKDSKTAGDLEEVQP